MRTYIHVLEILNSLQGVSKHTLKQNIMNIPAELVMVANTCDMHNLTEEADILTNIAQFLMSQDSGNGQLEQPTPSLDPEQMQSPQREMQQYPREEQPFQSPMDKTLGR